MSSQMDRDVDDDVMADAGGVRVRYGGTVVRCGGEGRLWMLLGAFRRWKESAEMSEMTSENG